VVCLPAGKRQPNDPTSPMTTLSTAWTKVRDKAKVVGRWHSTQRGGTGTLPLAGRSRQSLSKAKAERNTERSGVFLAPGNEVFALLGRTGTGRCLAGRPGPSPSLASRLARSLVSSRLSVLPALEIPGRVSKPNEAPRKYQGGPSSWAATASGEGGDSTCSCLAGGRDYRRMVRGGDTDLLPVIGMSPGHAGVPTAANVAGTVTRRFRDQSPVGQFLETEGHSCRSSFGVRALGAHTESGTGFVDSAQFPATRTPVAATAKRHRGG
jgi:hypothetical protein